MNPMVCKNCGGSEFRRIGINYACSYCGTRYLINGMDVGGFLEGARRAYSMEDWSEAQRYYNLVELHCPSNIEAIYFSAYCKLREVYLTDNVPARKNAFTVLNSAIDLIAKHFVCEDIEVLKKISASVMGIKKVLSGGLLINCSSLTDIHRKFCDSLSVIAHSLPENDINRKTVYLCALNHVAYIMQIAPDPTAYNQMAQFYIDKIKVFDPDFSFALPQKPVGPPPKAKEAVTMPAFAFTMVAFIFEIVGFGFVMGVIETAIMGLIFNIFAIVFSSIAVKATKRSFKFANVVNILGIIAMVIEVIIVAVAAILSVIYG